MVPLMCFIGFVYWPSGYLWCNHNWNIFEKLIGKFSPFCTGRAICPLCFCLKPLSCFIYSSSSLLILPYSPTNLYFIQLIWDQRQNYTAFIYIDVSNNVLLMGIATQKLRKIFNLRLKFSKRIDHSSISLATCISKHKSNIREISRVCLENIKTKCYTQN